MVYHRLLVKTIVLQLYRKKLLVRTSARNRLVTCRGCTQAEQRDAGGDSTSPNRSMLAGFEAQPLFSSHVCTGR